MRRVEQVRNAPLVRPLTARSVILSALLGTHPAVMTSGELVRLGALFEIAEGTVRVALSRMTTSGDLRHRGDGYELTARLIDRQRQQDASRNPRARDWDGQWRMITVAASRRERAERDRFRTHMAHRHFAELREGVWLRPDNLRRPEKLPQNSRSFTAVPEEDPTELAAGLWDLTAWSGRARSLHDAMDDAAPVAAAFAISAAVVRHLLIDPILPPELLPRDWPGERLRMRYEEFDARFRAELHRHIS